MFNLETSIATWRHSLRLRRVLLDEDLEELEQHVRDQVCVLIRRGRTEEEAFREALRVMGDAGAVESAYRRVYWGKLKRKGLLKDTFITEIRMWKNYLTIAVRNLLRHPGYTFINVAGLATGIACCLLIVLFVRDELAFDRYNEHADRVVRVTLRVPELDRDIEVTPTVVAPLFKRTFPEVEDATRIYDISRFRKTTIRHGGEAWQEDGFMYADSTVFDVFTFPFLDGDPHRALTRPNTLVLTRSAAEKYFGDPMDAVGRTLGVGSSGEFEVTGVIEDIPATSHLRFNVLGSFVSTSWAGREIWDSANFYTYLLLTPGAALSDLRAKVDEQLTIAKREMGLPEDLNLGLQPLRDIYLVYMGRMKYVWMFSALAALLLGIACINYMNLSTARSARRAREVGMRKALGAHRGQLVRQFFGESALLTFLAFIFAIGLAALMLPFFNRVSLKALSLDIFLTPGMLFAVVALLAAITIGAGLYPSLVLSAFRPAAVLKGGRHGLTGGDWLRKTLVVFQFGVTIFLLVSMTVVYRQLHFIKTTDVGFDREQVVVIPLADAGSERALPSLKEELARNPRILSMSAMNNIPGAMRGGYSLFVEGENPVDSENRRISASPVDDDAVETLGLDLLAGTSFSEPTDYLANPDSSRYEYVVNESLVRLAGWTPQSAVGRHIGVSANRMGQIVGVIRDFNFLTLRDQMYPLALFVEPSWNVLLVKIAPTGVATTISDIRETWTRVAGGSPFSYTFLDDDFAAFYDSENRLGRIFGGATVLAILIACLGLFGLASYTAEARTKEIGIRKSLGASVPALITMLNRDFAWLVLVGFVLATPLAWWAAHAWLEGYAYRTHLSWWIFVASGAASLLIALATVSYQSIRAANSDPVKTLRYE